jgi:hypothetical protein
MSETNQRLLATFGVLALLLGLSGCAGRAPQVTEVHHHHYEQATSPAPTPAPASPEEYCAEQGADGWKIVEVRCLRRLNAGVCSGGEECDLFPEMRHVENLDSSRDIRCAGDTGGDHYTDFGVTSCEYVGRDGVAPEPASAAAFFDILESIEGGGHAHLREFCNYVDGARHAAADQGGDSYCHTAGGTFGVRERHAGGVHFSAFFTKRKDVGRPIVEELSDRFAFEQLDEETFTVQLPNGRALVLTLSDDGALFQLYTRAGLDALEKVSL